MMQSSCLKYLDLNRPLQRLRCFKLLSWKSWTFWQQRCAHTPKRTTVMQSPVLSAELVMLARKRKPMKGREQHMQYVACVIVLKTLPRRVLKPISETRDCRKGLVWAPYWDDNNRRWTLWWWEMSIKTINTTHKNCLIWYSSGEKKECTLFNHSFDVERWASWWIDEAGRRPGTLGRPTHL
jgi:hypothetical protein